MCIKRKHFSEQKEMRQQWIRLMGELAQEARLFIVL